MGARTPGIGDQPHVQFPTFEGSTVQAVAEDGVPSVSVGTRKIKKLFLVHTYTSCVSFALLRLESVVSHKV